MLSQVKIQLSYYVCMYGCMYGCMDGWMDGWMDDAHHCGVISIINDKIDVSGNKAVDQQDIQQ